MTTDVAFDPLADLLAEQEARPAGLAPVDPASLSPYERALLVTDGTVTKFIEAYRLEPVQVELLGQETHDLAKDSRWLEAPAGTPVIARQVILRGQDSGTAYAYASSRLVHDRLPPFVRAQLERDPHGIGHILLESRLETFREVLWYGQERLERPPQALAHLAGQVFTSRTYRIFAGGHPLMLINETFPPNVD
ncbi:MAG: chorismate pyruvate-lyase family protein [Pseudomonadota bacterium]